MTLSLNPKLFNFCQAVGMREWIIVSSKKDFELFGGYMVLYKKIEAAIHLGFRV